MKNGELLEYSRVRATGLENALTNALFENPRLTLSADEVTRIRGLCVTGSCRSNVEVLVGQRPP